MNPPLRIAIAGMGGYAGSHHEAILRIEEKLQARLICTCDPNPLAFAAQQQTWRLVQRGVSVFSEYGRMLEVCASQLDLVVIATPIQFHAEMHRTAVEHGVAVYLEKPPTLDYCEFEKMIRVEESATRTSVIGFNFIVESARLALKQRLLAGEFGAIREARLLALSSRPTIYFKRNAWTGRLIVGDQIVLDSCFGNDLAHFVHNLLFWVGPADVFDWPSIASVQAELYRAHLIESADTFFVEAKTTQGTLLRFAMSQAHAAQSAHSETIYCEKASLRYTVGREIEIHWLHGQTERIALEPFDALLENHLHYYRYLRGEIPRPATTLTDARPFVVLNDLAFISSGEISNIPRAQVSMKRNEKELQEYYSVADLEHVLDEFLARGRWPSKEGWARSAVSTVVTPADLSRFERTVRKIAASGSRGTLERRETSGESREPKASGAVQLS